MDKQESFLKGIARSLIITAGTTLVTDLVKHIGKTSSKINISEWDSAYNNINKIIYNLNKEKFEKHRTPTTNKDYFELTDGTSYNIRFNDGNYIKVESYKDKDEKKIYPEQRLRISFYGKNKYQYRSKLLKNAMKLTDDNKIFVKHLNEYDITCDVTPHRFNRIILDKFVKSRIIKGLKNWSKSKEWYDKNELTYKIGVFLYGEAGTGKSTIAKAISAMFKNAPILTVDSTNVMLSISQILKMRKKYDGTMIVLIEDFDMYFKSREENEGIELDVNQKKMKDNNQNAIFQLLDGVYSTDNTIYVATTNYKERIDKALIRYGRFDIQEEIKHFTKELAVEFVELLGYDKNVLEELNITSYPIQPSHLQSMIMDYRAKSIII